MTYYFRCRVQNESLHSQSRFRDLQRISRGKLDRLLRTTTEFTLCALDRYGLRDHLPARPTLTPLIRFLYIGSHICSTLPSEPVLRRRPCASISLHPYQVVKRTYTFKLSNMLGTQKKGAELIRAVFQKVGTTRTCFHPLRAQDHRWLRDSPAAPAWPFRPLHGAWRAVRHAFRVVRQESFRSR